MPKTPSSRRIFRERLKLFAGPNHLYYNKDRLRLLQVEPRNIEMEESCGYFQDPVEYPMHKIKDCKHVWAHAVAGVVEMTDWCGLFLETLLFCSVLCLAVTFCLSICFAEYSHLFLTPRATNANAQQRCDVSNIHAVQWAMTSVGAPVCLMPSMMASSTTADINVSKPVSFQCKTWQLDPELAMTAETSATVSCSKE